METILASASPRRRELLRYICPEYTVMPADIDETPPEGTLPENKEDAARMLRLLSGTEHSVYTGVSLRLGASERFFTQRTRVWFYPLTEREIADYTATGEPMDKAGAYGIQGYGCALAERIDGDYFNVMGLPVARLKRELEALLAQNSAPQP